MTEFRLFDSPGADVAEITTDGDTFKPFLNSLTQIVSEAKVNVSDEGIQSSVVDPANVCMAAVTLDADAFETFTVNQHATIAPNVDELSKVVRRARKGHDDELRLSIQERELTASVSRGYDNHTVASQGEMKLIDPDSIRDEPNIPDLEWSAELQIDRKPLIDALKYAVGTSDHITVSVKGVNQHTNALYIGGETDTLSESAAIDNIDTDATVEAKYSVGYVKDILSILSSSDAETVNVRLDDEYPIVFEIDDGALHLEYFLAPRIQK